MVKATDFKFDTHVSSYSPYMNLNNFHKRGRDQGHVTPLNVWALYANISKTVKATDFKFDVHVSRDSSYMTQKFPPYFLAVKCQ